MAATRLIAMHVNKGCNKAQCLQARLDYAANPSKTEDGELVTSYECDPKTAAEEFLLLHREYEQTTGKTPKNDVIAYQIRQSFKPGEVTPEEANAIGRELAMRFSKGKHAFIVATHTDRDHIHNHIIFNSVTLDASGKFRDFKRSGLALARCSDTICLEHSLSVIEKKPAGERTKAPVYPKQKTFRDEIREAIDEAIDKKPANFEELIELLREAGYEYKSGKQPALRGKGQKRFIRFRSLGDGYSVEELSAVFAGKAVHKSRKPQIVASGRAGSRQPHDRTQVSFMIDIQRKVIEGKGGGYTQWARVFNLKQMAKTLLFLQEQGISSYEELCDRTDEITSQRDELLSSIKEDEARLKELSTMITHLANYAKSKEAFIGYKNSGYSDDYYEANRELLTIHYAAKKAFDEYESEHGKGTPLPKAKELAAEYSIILGNKRRTYAMYREVRKEQRNWQAAKEIVQRILGEEIEVPKREGPDLSSKQSAVLPRGYLDS